jgi:hypothetical protein
LQQPPYVYKKVDNNTGLANYSGYCIDLLNELAKMMNFKYEIFEAPGKNLVTIVVNKP